MKKLISFTVLFSIFTFTALLSSCGDEGSPPLTIYNNDAEVSEIGVDLNNCTELAWVENTQECCADDTGCLPTACSLEQREYKCWISCEGRFGGVPTTNTRFLFDEDGLTFSIDYREFGIVDCQ